MMADISKFTEIPLIDESTEDYACHEYDPIPVTNLNDGCCIRIIRISIESQDEFAHASENYMIFEHCQSKADNTAYANAYQVDITNNAIMHICSRIEHHLSNQLMESLSYPGQATTMFGLLKFPDDFSKAQGLNQLW